MKKVYAEIGFGNGTFLSTEYEEGENEYRVPKFILPGKILECYVRYWVGKNVYIFSTKQSFKVIKKDRKKFKILFGIGGETY